MKYETTRSTLLERIKRNLKAAPWTVDVTGWIVESTNAELVDDVNRYVITEIVRAVTAERERWLVALRYAVSQANAWHDRARGGPIESPEMDFCYALLNEADEDAKSAAPAPARCGCGPIDPRSLAGILLREHDNAEQAARYAERKAQTLIALGNAAGLDYAKAAEQLRAL